MNIGRELLLTWSKKASFFSSKKIIQNSSYTIATLMLFIHFLAKLFCWTNCKDLSVTETCMMATLIYSIGGYTTHKLLQEKKHFVNEQPKEIAEAKAD